MHKPELLAPAGNPEKLKTALLYGADAVYAGGRNFSLRQYADNFSVEELADGVSYAHSLGKKVYVTANIFPKNSDFKEAEEYFVKLKEMSVDAVLVTDVGFLNLIKKVAPDLDVHISTQANTLNKYAARFWAEQGAKRVVLARELSIDDVREIAEYNPGLELECFVHGAMCVSYSGRCLLSNYLSGRDANRGECVQACRWKYKLTEVCRDPENALEIEEDERGAYILNSKDLNLIGRLDELQNAGVCSFKIEGRMKSVYYLATVVNAYRRALDGFPTETAAEELTKINHRAYTEAYFDGDNSRTLNYGSGQETGEYDFIGVVEAFDKDTASVEMRNRFKKGDELEVLSPRDSFLKKFTVGYVTDEEGNEVEDAKIVQQRLFVKTPFKLYPGDILRRR